MKKKIPYGSKIPVEFTIAERDFIRDKTFCNPDFAKLAKLKGKFIQVNMSLDDIEEIQGYIAAETNHTEDKKLKAKLGKIFEKLQKFLENYDDQDINSN